MPCPCTHCALLCCLQAVFIKEINEVKTNMLAVNNKIDILTNFVREVCGPHVCACCSYCLCLLLLWGDLTPTPAPTPSVPADCGVQEQEG